MDRWQEYRDGKLFPPCVVQCDGDEKKGYLIWIWIGDVILGPISRMKYDEKAIIAEVPNLIPQAEEVLEEERYTVSDIESILKEKGYLEETEKLTDLKDAGEFVSEKSVPTDTEKVS